MFNLQIPAFLRNIPVCNTTCQALQRRALESFYSNTNGPRWLKRKKWNTTAFYCDWEGVICYNRTLHIIAIKLEGNNGMEGYVGSSLGELPYLLGVNMGGGCLLGDIGKLLGTLKEFFVRIDFAFNKLKGEFPQTITKMFKSLGKIQLSGNANITGRLPHDICVLTDLQVLSLGETAMFGSIPNCISNLTKLYFFDLEALSLTGKLDYLQGLVNLKWIHLMSNAIDGKIPSDFGNWFPKLKELILQGNNLHGPVPSSLANLSQLSLLQLSGNKKLTGPIPISFSNLTSLTMLDISFTEIVGFESGLVLQSPSLNSFIAKGNKYFSESIYRLIEVLAKSRKSLIQLNVQDCDIYGKFDKYNDETNLVKGIFQFSKLGFLNLGGNKGLYGTIPDPIGSIGLLMFFNVSYTNLSSALPVSYLIKLNVLQEIDIRGNPLMKGDIDQYFIDIDYTVMAKERKSDKFVCPALRFRHNKGNILSDSSYYNRAFCQCIPGYYGLGGFCKKCISGGICDGKITASEKNNTTSENYLVTKLKLKKGYWPYPNRKRVTQFLPCQWTLPGKEICNPDSSVNCFLKKIGNKFVTVCEGDLCKKGSRGRLCSECERDFFKSGAHCHSCPDENEKSKVAIIITISVFMIVLLGASLVLFLRHQKVFAIIFAIIQAVATFLLAVFGIIPGWLAQINILLFLITVAGFGKTCKVLMKIVVFYVQIVDSLITSAHIWPVAFYDFAKYLSSVVSLRFSVLKCQQPGIFNPVGQLIMLMAIPLAAIFVLGTFAFIACRITRRKWPDANAKIKYKCGHFAIMLLNLSYFPLVKATASVLIPCHEALSDLSFMVSYPWVDCPSQLYNLVKSLALASLFLYVMGIPALFLGLLIWKREDVANGNQSTQEWLGSLYAPYKAKHRVFMEVLLMMRRTALAFFSAFFADDISLQIALISVVFLISLTYESQTRPFLPTNHKAGCDGTPQHCSCLGLENLLELVMLVTLFTSFVAVKSSVLEKHVSVSLIWVIGLVNVAFGVVLTVSFISRMLRREPGHDGPHEGDALI